MIADVADQQTAVGRNGNAVRLAKLCARRRTAVPREPGDAGPGQCGDDAGVCLDLSHHVVVTLGDIHVALGVERDLVGHVQRARKRRSAVPEIGPLTVAGYGRRLPCPEIEAPDALVVEVAEVQRVVADEDAVRVVHLLV